MAAVVGTGRTSSSCSASAAASAAKLLQFCMMGCSTAAQQLAHWHIALSEVCVCRQQHALGRWRGCSACKTAAVQRCAHAPAFPAFCSDNVPKHFSKTGYLNVKELSLALNVMRQSWHPFTCFSPAAGI
jgi:hypothetical protein